MGDTGEQHGTVALDLAQVADHRVEAMIDGGKFRRPRFGQR
jgi:hypothetical protein